MSSDNWDDESTRRPPDNPSKVIYHGPYKGYQGEKQIPEEVRRVFGSPPPKDSQRPIPPPPLPPNSYHKKPKYWQMRYTSHQQIPNRMAGLMCIGFCGIAYLINKLSNAPERWGKRLGYQMSPEEKIDYDLKNQFYFEMMSKDGAPPEQYTTDLSGEHYINVRRADNKIRWDIREVDTNMVNARELTVPLEGAL